MSLKLAISSGRADAVLSVAQRQYFETHLPVLQGLSAARRAELATLARPGESWEQLVVRLEAERQAAFRGSLAPCRLCLSVEHYQTEACQRMGICDPCNAALEAELLDSPRDDD